MTVIEKEQVINAAQEAAENAYVPYSKFRVGAALITTAIFKAVSEGHRDFECLAVYGDTKEPISPCGACRQVMAEFFKSDSKVILIAEDKSTVEMTVGELLPYSFTDLQ